MKHWNLLKINYSISKILIFNFILYLNFFNSQTKRFYYDIKFKIDTINTYKDETMVLDINKENNIFYNNSYLETEPKKDSYFNDIVISDKNRQDYKFIKELSMYYYKYNSIKKINWRIETEKKKIGTYTVQKATANFAGRNWIAWFSQEIPLPYGPYFFSGLPGLILEIYDNHENFHFTFIENKNLEKTTSEDLVAKLTKNFSINIKEEDWKRIQINYYKDPLKEYKSGDAYMEHNNGEKYTNSEYKEIEISTQNEIKKYNNPIELDKKIYYK